MVVVAFLVLGRVSPIENMELDVRVELRESCPSVLAGVGIFVMLEVEGEVEVVELFDMTVPGVVDDGMMSLLGVEETV